MSRQPHDTPTEATAEHGEVMLDGPDGLALSMTPAAANASAEALRRAAAQAQDQEQAPGDAPDASAD